MIYILYVTYIIYYVISHILSISHLFLKIWGNTFVFLSSSVHFRLHVLLISIRELLPNSSLNIDFTKKRFFNKSLRRFLSGNLPKTLQKLSVSTKLSLQEIKWNFVILCNDEVNAFDLITFLILSEALIFIFYFFHYLLIHLLIYSFIVYLAIIVLDYTLTKCGRVFGAEAAHQGRWIIFVLSKL